MRKIMKRILEILDGTPAVYGKKEKGQSLMEMTLITPLILILIVGIVEVGWFANNYLVLLEVTRVGARRGAVLAGDNSPINWDNRASLPQGMGQYDPNFDPTFSDSNAYDQDEWAQVENLRFQVRGCGIEYSGFYGEVICQMLRSLDPLQIRRNPTEPEDRVDDIIISVFSIQNIYNAPVTGNPDTSGDYDFINNYDPVVNYNEYPPGYIPVVVGRWPTNANRCTVWEDMDGNTFVYSGFERDPFDYINDEQSPNVVIVQNPNTGQVVGSYPLEMAHEVANGWLSMGYQGPDVREYFRGFALTGFHRAEMTQRNRARFNLPADGPIQVPHPGGGTVQAQPLCFGSNWTIYDVQELMRGSAFQMTASEIQEMRDRAEVGPDFGIECDENGQNCRDVDTGMYHTNQGLVLVEIYWGHRLLLDLPAFSPVFNALGSNRTTIYVWSAFPVPAAAPNIRYNLTWRDFVDEN